MELKKLSPSTFRKALKSKNVPFVSVFREYKKIIYDFFVDSAVEECFLSFNVLNKKNIE